MIFANHNLTENFFNATGKHDKPMRNTILIDEIGRLIADHKEKVVAVLRRHNVKGVKEMMPNDKLARIAANNLIDNRPLAEDFSKLIISNSITPDEFLKATNVLKKEIKKRKQQRPDGTVHFVDDITNVDVNEKIAEQKANEIMTDGLMDVFKADKKGEGGINENRLVERLRLLQMAEKKRSGAGMSKKTKVILISSGILLTGVAVFFITRYFIKKAIEKKMGESSGEDMNNNNVVEPVQQMQPAQPVQPQPNTPPTNPTITINNDSNNPTPNQPV